MKECGNFFYTSDEYFEILSVHYEIPKGIIKKTLTPQTKLGIYIDSCELLKNDFASYSFSRRSAPNKSNSDANISIYKYNY